MKQTLKTAAAIIGAIAAIFAAGYIGQMIIDGCLYALYLVLTLIY